MSGMPHNTRFMPPKAKRLQEDEFTEPMPLTRTNSNHANLPPLARIHRKDNPRAWKEAFGEGANGMESMDLETLKRRLPENRWKRLLEELYRDKKYFDYVKSNDLFVNLVLIIEDIMNRYCFHFNIVITVGLFFIYSFNIYGMVIFLNAMFSLSFPR